MLFASHFGESFIPVPKARIPQLLLLENPNAVVAGRAQPLLTADLSRRRGKRPVLFIHGMEYFNAEEVVRDLIVPFFSAADTFSHCERDDIEVFCLHWDSRADLTSDKPLAGDQGWSDLLKVWGRALEFRSRLRCLENRARGTAWQCWADVRSVLTGDFEQEPMIVTHSMGAVVWCELLKFMWHGDRMDPRLGHWWNMQPALRWSDFHESAPYEYVPWIYNSKHQATISIWFSRYDLVLGTLFAVAKRCLAMGQIGSPGCDFTQRDVTGFVREAHGHAYLDRKRGSYFERTKQSMREHARITGLTLNFAEETP